jgi:hypothetical protein
MTPEQHTRKDELQRELLALRRESCKRMMSSTTKDALRQRTRAVIRELLSIDPNAATYEAWGNSKY